MGANLTVYSVEIHSTLSEQIKVYNITGYTRVYDHEHWLLLQAKFWLSPLDSSSISCDKTCMRHLINNIGLYITCITNRCFGSVFVIFMYGGTTAGLKVRNRLALAHRLKVTFSIAFVAYDNPWAFTLISWETTNTTSVALHLTVPFVKGLLVLVRKKIWFMTEIDTTAIQNIWRSCSWVHVTVNSSRWNIRCLSLQDFLGGGYFEHWSSIFLMKVSREVVLTDVSIIGVIFLSRKPQLISSHFVWLVEICVVGRFKMFVSRPFGFLVTIGLVF